MIGAQILVQISRVQSGVYHRLAGRHGDPVTGGCKAAADAQDRIGPLQEMGHGPRHGTPPGSQGERVVLRKGALALQTGHDRSGEQLGQLPQPFPGARVVNALTGVDERARRLDQNARRLFHIPRVRPRARTGGRGIVQRFGDFLLHEIHGNLHHHRARATIARARKSATQGVPDDVGTSHLFGPLGDALVVGRGAEIGGLLGQPARVPGRQHHHGHRFAIGLRHAAKGVFRPRALLHDENAQGPAGVDAAEAIGHVQTGAFLARDDGVHIGTGSGFDNIIERITDEKLDAFALENLDHGIDGLHLPSPRNSGANQNTRKPTALSEPCQQPGPRDQRTPRRRPKSSLETFGKPICPFYIEIAQQEILHRK